MVNEEIGKVELRRAGVKSSVGHVIGRIKAVAFKSVPEVISKGKIIDAQHDWKGREYNTLVIAAPIDIAGQQYYVATVINRNSARNVQHYYLHEVGVIKKNSMPSKTVAANKSGSHGGTTIPIYNLLQQINDVNNLTVNDIVSEEGRFSLKASTNKTLTKEQREYFENVSPSLIILLNGPELARKSALKEC